SHGRTTEILISEKFQPPLLLQTFGFEVGCIAPAPHCGINNATHSGLRLPSPTICNCCDYCMPFFGKGEYCSLGGPGTGTTVGRCGPGLTCTDDEDAHSNCQRITSKCHDAQDEYDKRYEQGTVGSLEFRRQCDGRGNFSTFDCVPTQTCFCQSENGERIFGEMLEMGAVTIRNMHCGCSRFHEKMAKNIAPGVPYPVEGPRCTSDGNFNPVQCLNRTCYCVDKITGVALRRDSINLDEKPITELSCYDEETDLFPSQSLGEAPYNYTTPCLEHVKAQIALLKQSVEDGFDVDFFSSIRGCLPDGTFGRIDVVNGTKICIDERRQRIGEYEALRHTPEYETMNCKCAQTQQTMGNSLERPVCCKNGNFREIQCRRGICRCVDPDGRQVYEENSDVTKLSCFNPNQKDWREC
ncbi:uncharacterized protein LOC113227832, partial [Hyposmocoma kahamanoa]|uniref:uncharacterized protein LOC113227832 n=1 Tax=Hyposmocoma kahamanoa TaxID=1477025 RepID=UPI000E6D7E66